MLCSLHLLFSVLKPRPRLAEKILDGVNAGHAGLVAMETAVDMERESQGLILELMDRAERQRVQDPHVSDWETGIDVTECIVCVPRDRNRCNRVHCVCSGRQEQM